MAADRPDHEADGREVADRLWFNSLGRELETLPEDKVIAAVARIRQIADEALAFKAGLDQRVEAEVAWWSVRPTRRLTSRIAGGRRAMVRKKPRRGL